MALAELIPGAQALEYVQVAALFLALGGGTLAIGSTERETLSVLQAARKGALSPKGLAASALFTCSACLWVWTPIIEGGWAAVALAAALSVACSVALAVSSRGRIQPD